MTSKRPGVYSEPLNGGKDLDDASSLGEDKGKCECAVMGVFNAPRTDASQLTYYGLHALQHRGQESAGILSMCRGDIIHKKRKSMSPIKKFNRSDSSNSLPAARDKINLMEYKKQDPKPQDEAMTYRPPKMTCHKGFGLVLDVFASTEIFTKKLMGESAIGHTRYSTSGSTTDSQNVQPFFSKYKDGNLAIAHNGNITNFRQIHERLVEKGTLFQTSSDSELLLHLIAQSKKETQIDQVLDAVSQLQGAYCFLILTDTKMFAVRDPSGFRPLCMGQIGDSNTKGGPAICFASETCAIDLIDAKYIRDVEPGEVIELTEKGCRTLNFNSYRVESKFQQPVSPCVFEFVYFARPDSMVFGQMVDTVRHRTGVLLAQEAPVGEKIPEGDEANEDDAIIICAVPDSSNTAALGYQQELSRMGYNAKYGIAIIRNHYVGRTFISPNQNARELKVRCKFNIVKRVVEGRTVVMVDDSIVRGTTSRQLIKMMREAGAKDVHFRVASPPVVGPCFYGMDFPTKKELMANSFTSFASASRWLKADSLQYLSVRGLMNAVREGDPRGKGEIETPDANKVSPYCGACFTGVYPVPYVSGEDDLSW